MEEAAFTLDLILELPEKMFAITGSMKVDICAGG